MTVNDKEAPYQPSWNDRFSHWVETLPVRSWLFHAVFGLALILFAGIRERFEISRIPKALQGTGIGLVTAGLLALSFFAFKGMI